MGAYRGNLIDENKNEIKLLNSLNFNSYATVLHFDDRVSIVSRSSETGVVNGLRLYFTITPDSYMEKSDINYIFWNIPPSNTFQINLSTNQPLYFIELCFKTAENSENYFNIMLLYDITFYNGIGNIEAERIPQAKTSLNSLALTVKDFYIYSNSNFASLYDMKGNLGVTLSENFTARISGFAILLNRNGKV